MYAKTNAILSGETKIIDLLCKYGADLTHKDVYGKTVYDWAKDESSKLYDYLIEKQ
jgi:ankyrin repeat protein